MKWISPRVRSSILDLVDSNDCLIGYIQRMPQNLHRWVIFKTGEASPYILTFAEAKEKLMLEVAKARLKGEL